MNSTASDSTAVHHNKTILLNTCLSSDVDARQHHVLSIAKKQIEPHSVWEDSGWYFESNQKLEQLHKDI